MHASLLNAILIAVTLIGTAAVASYRHLSARRRGRRHAEWRAVADALVELDSDLDRVWAREIRRQYRPGR
ncbi:MAG: hypothetical protein ACRDN0_27000 [Trebonia sp.]